MQWYPASVYHYGAMHQPPSTRSWRHWATALLLVLALLAVLPACLSSDGAAVESVAAAPNWRHVCYDGAERPIAEALGDGEIQAVYHLEADQTFDRWFADRPDLSTITTIHPYEPLFVLAAASVTWEPAADSVPPSAASLAPGWNAVCYSGVTRPAAEATAGIGEHLTVLYSLAASGAWQRFAPGRPDVSNLAELHPLDAVLLLATGPGTTPWAFSPGASTQTRADGAVRLTVAAAPASNQNPAFSPDGTRLVFTRFDNGYNRGPAGLCLLELSTGRVSRLTPVEDQDNVNLPGAAWSGAADAIVFASDRAEADDLWMITPDGGDIRRITTHGDSSAFIEPSWSPDGQWIVFEVSQPGESEDGRVGQVWKARADGSELTQLTTGPDDRQPNWSPVGDRIVFQRRVPSSENWDLYTMSVDGTDIHPVVTAPSSDTDASWSSDGRWIVFSSDYGGLPVPNIFVVPAQGGTPIRVTRHDTHEDGAPSWSPDGEWIAFESHLASEEDTPSDLWRIAAPTSALSFAWPDWARQARIAGAFFEPGDSDEDTEGTLDDLASQGVSVVLADSPWGWSYSAWVDDTEFSAVQELVATMVQKAHQRGLKVVMYQTGLELIAEAPRDPGSEHPDWPQVSLDGQSIVFSDISSEQEHWLEEGQRDIWLSPCSSYRQLSLARVREMASTGIDGLWVDTVYLQHSIGDHQDLWPSTDSCSAAAFQSATGLSVPAEEDWDGPGWRRWIVWRHDQMTDYLLAVKQAAREVNPGLVFFEENWNVDGSGATQYANDPAAYLGYADMSTGHEVSTIGDRVDEGQTGMQDATLDQWLAFVTMIKWARGADAGKPSWVLTYGYQAADAERLAGVILAEGANYYETRGPSMADSVGADYRRRIFSWTAAHQDALYGGESAATVALAYSPRTRDLLDEGAGDLYEPEEAPFFREYRQAAATLLRNHIPFDVVILDDSLSTSRLVDYQTIVLPNVAAMSDGEAAAVRSFAEGGGQVVHTGETGSRDEWLDPRAANALDGLPSTYIETVTTEAGADALRAAADAGQIVTDLTPWVHVGLRETSDGLQLVLVNLGQNAVQDAELTVRLPEGAQVEGVSATSPDDGAVAVDYAVENGYLRLTLADLPVLSLVEVRLG